MCSAVLSRDINDVSGWFCRILGPVDPNLGLRTPVESYMRATQMAFKAGDEALFPNQHTRSKDALSAYDFFIRVRVRVRLGKVFPLAPQQAPKNILPVRSRSGAKFSH